MGNKLIEEWKVRQNSLKDKLKFVIKALTDKDAAYILAGYNGLKQRALMLSGVGMGDAAMKKIQLIKRLTNQGYNLQVMAANGLKEFLASERAREEAEGLEYERQQKERDRILRRIMDSNVRMMGVGFRQALQWTVADREAEIKRAMKMRGIMNRIVDSNVRLMGMGYNKLIEEWRARMAEIRDKLKFVIRSLTDQQARFILMAYNSLQQRANMLNGAGMSHSQMAKIQLIKRLTNRGYNLQVMGVNAIREFLTDARYQDDMARLEAERQAKEKDRILRRIMNGNLRMLGTAFRQALQWTIADREAEIARVNKQRGIMRRIVDSNVRLMGMGYNKLVEEWKARMAEIRDKLKFVIRSLTDQQARYILM